MKNLRVITPIIMTLCLGILSYLVFELRGTRAYADQVMTRHTARPHVGTVQREDFKELNQDFRILSREMGQLRTEVRLLRVQITKFNGEGLR